MTRFWSWVQNSYLHLCIIVIADAIGRCSLLTVPVQQLLFRRQQVNIVVLSHTIYTPMERCSPNSVASCSEPALFRQC